MVLEISSTTMEIAKIDENWTFLSSKKSYRQFHQRFLRVFSYKNFGTKPNVTSKKLLKKCSYEKFVCIKLMKLTTGKLETTETTNDWQGLCVMCVCVMSVCVYVFAVAVPVL